MLLPWGVGASSFLPFFGRKGMEKLFHVSEIPCVLDCGRKKLWGWEGESIGKQEEQLIWGEKGCQSCRVEVRTAWVLAKKLYLAQERND